MNNPHAIQIHCDGAMDYDPQQTGGGGYEITFPDSIDAEPIQYFYRSDGRGIHRLEMISIIHAMEGLLEYAKANPDIVRQASGVEIYTDRHSVTDGELINPYKIQGWRKNKWKNYEGKDIKDADLLDKIDKTRLKLAKAVGGQVSVDFKRRKENKVADKLSKVGKKSRNYNKKEYRAKNRRVIRRLYDGEEVIYSDVKAGDIAEMRVYAWELLKKEFEVCFEACSGEHEGKIIKTTVSPELKASLHRGHVYLIEIDDVFNHHVSINLLEEVET